MRFWVSLSTRGVYSNLDGMTGGVRLARLHPHVGSIWADARVQGDLIVLCVCLTIHGH